MDAQEPNHHRTYVLLLDELGSRELSREVLDRTYYYCRELLESDRAITQTNERTLIKQLGAWLGLLTFARNKPVLAKVCRQQCSGCSRRMHRQRHEHQQAVSCCLPSPIPQLWRPTRSLLPLTLCGSMVQDMDLKQLVADAYTRGRMIAVLPFVEKVLSGCKDSKVCVGMGAPTCCHMYM